MSRIFVLLLTLAMSASSWGALPGSWQEIVNNPKFKKTPTTQQVQARAIQGNGGLQTFTLADRFVFVFDQTGQPIVTFDLMLEPLGLGDMIMGSIGIGAWSLKNFMNQYKNVKENPEALLKQEQIAQGQLPALAADDQADSDLYSELDKSESTGWSDKDVERGYKQFAKLKFNDSWIQRNLRLQNLQGGNRDGFKPASFTLGDLYLEPDQQAAVTKVMKQFSQVAFGASIEERELSSFMSQFQMEWSEQNKAFTMSWKPASFSPERGNIFARPKIPGWVLNYADPLDLLAYKYSLVDLTRQVMALESILPTMYASIAEIMVSRVVNGLKARLDTHENQLQSLLEGYMRGEYQINIPLVDAKQFIETSILMLYLNKMVDTDDVTDAVAKMKVVMDSEAKYRTENLAWFSKKGYQVIPWTDGRFATIFKDGKRKGIADLAMKSTWLVHNPSMHYYDAAPWLKPTMRVGLEAFTDAVRMVVPSAIDLSSLLANFINIGINIYIPGEIWDMVFRTRAYTEMGYEGQVFSQISETLKNRWKEIPGYLPPELSQVRSSMAMGQTNPFEIPLKYENAALVKNMKMVNDFLAGATASPRYVDWQ